jgi:hypothetical protein
MATPTTTMRLTASDRRRLDALAAARGIDRTAVVRRLLVEADETPAQSDPPTGTMLTEDDLLAVVVAATESNWRAATWLLERGWPERWAPRRTRPDADTFRTALKQAGITDEVRPFHDGRHTSITNAAAAGVAPGALQARAGHADLSTTQRYIDLAGVLFRDEAEAAEARMFGVAAPAPNDRGVIGA